MANKKQLTREQKDEHNRKQKEWYKNLSPTRKKKITQRVKYLSPEQKRKLYARRKEIRDQKKHLRPKKIMTPEERLKNIEYCRKRYATHKKDYVKYWRKHSANMTPEQKEKKRERNRKYWHRLSPQGRLDYVRANLQRKREKLDNMTPSQKADYFANIQQRKKAKLSTWGSRWQSYTPAQQTKMINEGMKMGQKRLKPLSNRVRDLIEKKTRKGSFSDDWRKERIARITATKVYRIIANTYANLNDLFLNLMRPGAGGPKTKPMELGIIYESSAVASFMTLMGVEKNEYKYPVGLTVHPELPFIACTPDAIAEGNMCVEFKYSYAPIHHGKGYLKRTPADSMGGIFMQNSYAKETTNLFQLKRNSPYYYQLVTQIICTGVDSGAIVVYHDSSDDPLKWDFWMEIVYRKEAEEAWGNMKPKLVAFYQKYFLRNDLADNTTQGVNGESLDEIWPDDYDELMSDEEEE